MTRSPDNHPFERLVDLVDGTLDAAARAEVQAHLDACASCAAEVAAARVAVVALGRLPEVEVPFGLMADVEAMARPAKAAVRASTRWVAALTAAAMITTGAVVGLRITRGGGGGGAGGGGAVIATAELRADPASDAGGAPIAGSAPVGAAAPASMSADATDESLQSLADSTAVATTGMAIADLPAFDSPDLACVLADRGGVAGVLVAHQLLPATYGGVDALVGAFVVTDGERSIGAVVIVVDRATCGELATFPSAL